MNNKLKLTFFGLFLCLNLYAQDRTGVYLTSADHMQHKLSYGSDCHSDRRAIRVGHSLINKPYFKVVHDGKKQVLQKKDVYGYLDCNNRTYRFYQNAAYRIEETGAINIYTQEEYVAQYKARNKVVLTYYFSVALDSAIVPLSVHNLKEKFACNDKFQELLDLHFQTTNVAAYDDLHKMYTINYLYARSMK